MHPVAAGSRRSMLETTARGADTGKAAGPGEALAVAA